LRRTSDGAVFSNERDIRFRVSLTKRCANSRQTSTAIWTSAQPGAVSLVQLGNNTMRTAFGLRPRPEFKQTPEQRCADVVAAQEFRQIQKFAAACRRQWPGAKICLRLDYDDAPASAGAPPNNLTPKQNGGSNEPGMG
jgi:hypothetical protein